MKTRSNKSPKSLEIKDLIFEKDVKKGDSVPTKPFSDELRQVNSEKDLEQLKNNYPQVIICIDRSKPWFSQFTVPAWEKERKAFAKGKMNLLNHWEAKE